MGENFQKSELSTLLQFVRVRAAHHPHVTTFNICQDILKSANLVHKRGLVASQSHTHVYQLSMYYFHIEMCHNWIVV